MALSLSQTKTAMVPGNTSSFLGVDGTPPYTYSVQPGGQGGTIDPVGGTYTAPNLSAYNSTADNASDTVIVTDSTGATASASILVGPVFILFLDIINTVMKLPPGRCFLYNGKGFQPTDAGLYIAVEVLNVKVFGNNTKFIPGPEIVVNSVNCGCTLDLHIISVDNSALYLKEIVLASLMSPYSISQQEGNNFSIGRIPPGAQFNNLSEIDGPAIPYHFSIMINLIYSIGTSSNVDVFTSFAGVTPVINA
jgi:hypothetical protein